MVGCKWSRLDVKDILLEVRYGVFGSWICSYDFFILSFFFWFVVVLGQRVELWVSGRLRGKGLRRGARNEEMICRDVVFIDNSVT